MAIVVVGGHTRNIGKTSVVAGILAALPQYRWTAFKVTQFGHGICSANGEPCDCETDSHTVAVSEEHATDTGTDTARFLRAGAQRVFWVRTRQGQLAEAMPRIRRELARADHAILESNSILRFLKPDLYLAVLDETVADFKPSAQYFLDRADAVLCVRGHSALDAAETPAWPRALRMLVKDKPRFHLELPGYTSENLNRFVMERIAQSIAASSKSISALDLE